MAGGGQVALSSVTFMRLVAEAEARDSEMKYEVEAGLRNP